MRLFSNKKRENQTINLNPLEDNPIKMVPWNDYFQVNSGGTTVDEITKEKSTD